MIRMFRTMDDTIQQVEETFDGVWIALTAPTQEELKQVIESEIKAFNEDKMLENSNNE